MRSTPYQPVPYGAVQDEKRPSRCSRKNLHMLDMFKYFPSPKVDNIEGVGSMLGGLTTLFVIILMIYFAIDTFFEFQGRSNPRIVQSVKIVEPADSLSVPYGLATQIDHEMYSDPRAFTVTVEQAIRTAEEGNVRTLLKLEECYVNALFPKALCPHDPVTGEPMLGTVQGGFINDIFQYVRVRLLPCVNGTSRDEDDELITCKSPEQIEDIFRRLTLNALFLTGLEEIETWESNIFLTYQPELISNTNIFVELHTLTSWERVFIGHEQVTVSTFSEIAEVMSYTEFITEPTQPIMQYYLRMGGRRHETEHHYDTVLELLATWGGLWTTLLVMGTPVLMFNNWRFWRYREWDLGEISKGHGKHVVEVNLTPVYEDSAMSELRKSYSNVLNVRGSGLTNITQL